MSDGATYSRLTLLDVHHYYQSKPDSKTLDEAYNDANLSSFSLGNAFSEGPPFFDHVLSDLSNSAANVVSMKIDPSVEMDGVLVDVVEVVVHDKLEDRVFQGTTIISLGQSDHLVRSIVQDMLQIGKNAGKHPITFHREEHYSSVQAPSSFPDTDFAYSPPAGLPLGNNAKLAAPEAQANAMYDPRVVVGAKPVAFQAVDLKGKPVSVNKYDLNFKFPDR